MHICNECAELCYEICNPPSAPKQRHAVINAIQDKVGDVRRRLDEVAVALPKLSRDLHDVCEDFVASWTTAPLPPGPRASAATIAT